MQPKTIKKVQIKIKQNDLIPQKSRIKQNTKVINAYFYMLWPLINKLTTLFKNFAHLYKYAHNAYIYEIYAHV